MTVRKVTKVYGSMKDRRVTESPTEFVNKWLTRIVIVFALIIALAVLCGCSTIKPLAEVSHTSHVTQHFGNNRTNYGWNVYSLGVRVRPYPGVTIDLLEGYSPEKLDGRHEVFQGRIQWEIGQ